MIRGYTALLLTADWIARRMNAELDEMRISLSAARMLQPASSLSTPENEVSVARALREQHYGSLQARNHVITEQDHEIQQLRAQLRVSQADRPAPSPQQQPMYLGKPLRTSSTLVMQYEARLPTLRMQLQPGTCPFPVRTRILM